MTYDKQFQWDHDFTITIKLRCTMITSYVQEKKIMQIKKITLKKNLQIEKKNL